MDASWRIAAAWVATVRRPGCLAKLVAPAPQPTKECQSKRSNYGGKDWLATHKIPNRSYALPGLAGELVHYTILPKFWVGGGVAKCLLELTFELGALTRDRIDMSVVRTFGAICGVD